MLFGLLSAIALLIFVEVVHVYDTRKQNEATSQFLEGFASFFGDQDEAGFTNFDKSVHQFAEQIGKAQAMTTVAAMRGSVSGAVRSAEGALEDEAIQADPMQAAVMKALPKRLAKNPLATMGLQYMMSKVASGSQPQNSNNGSKSTQVKFKL